MISPKELCSGALAALMTCGMPLTAFAAGPDIYDDASGTTSVKWYADNSQLSIMVPTTMHGVGLSDGTLQFVDNASFENKSIFDIYGQHYITAETGDVTLTNAAEPGANEVSVNVQNVKADLDYIMGPAKQHDLTGNDLKLEKETSYPLKASGKVNADPVDTATSLFTVEWHFNTNMTQLSAPEGENATSVVPHLRALNDYTWEELGQVSDSLASLKEASPYWERFHEFMTSQETKIMHMDYDNGMIRDRDENVQMVIAGINQDVDENGNLRGLTFTSKTALPAAVNTTSNNGGWTANWSGLMNDEGGQINRYIPDDVKAAAKTCQKKYTKYNYNHGVANVKFWNPSMGEMLGSYSHIAWNDAKNDELNAAMANLSPQYQYFADVMSNYHDKSTSMDLINSGYFNKLVKVSGENPVNLENGSRNLAGIATRDMLLYGSLGWYEMVMCVSGNDVFASPVLGASNLAFILMFAV